MEGIPGSLAEVMKYLRLIWIEFLVVSEVLNIQR